MPLKVTSWNIEHSHRLIGGHLSATNADRRRRVRETVEEIDPDILCMIEGPKGEAAISAFADDVLGGRWRPVLLQGPDDALGDRDDDYDTNGTQWIWFLAKAELAAHCRLQAPAVWRSFVGGSRWRVYYWGQQASSTYGHYRHPQVMILELGPHQELELIGLHLKSKINKNRVIRDDDDNIVGDFLEEALKARVKLATQARDVRAYIEARFEQIPKPAILMMGDVNDGVGHDYFERLYLFFDLIGNLQGNVMNADRFFNHALFDFPGDLRWTARYDDPVTKVKARDNPLLLDHILMSQPLVSGELPLAAGPRSGFVEHQAYERGNVGASEARKSSDHRPVSLVLSETGT